MKYFSTKTYEHNVGLSACFRQFRAMSHCRFLHGYALSVKFEFEGSKLDHKNWVMDFGALKPIKKYLEDTFDHKTLVAEDDPELPWFFTAHEKGLLDLVVVDATGCEKFAEMVFKHTKTWLSGQDQFSHVTLKSVEVREHGANSARVEE